MALYQPTRTCACRPRKLQHAISQRNIRPALSPRNKKHPTRKTSTNSFCVYINYIYICMYVCLSFFLPPPPLSFPYTQNTKVHLSVHHCDTAHFRSLVNAHEPISSFGIGAPGEISKSKMSIGMPIVVQAFGICVCQKKGKKERIQVRVRVRVLTSTMPATWPWIGAHERRRYICSIPFCQSFPSSLGGFWWSCGRLTS